MGSLLVARRFRLVRIALAVACMSVASSLGGSAADAQPPAGWNPSIVALAITPNPIDVTAGARQAMVTIRVSDALGLTTYLAVDAQDDEGRRLHPPTGVQQRGGDRFDSTWEAPIPVPQFFPAGPLRLQIVVYTSEGPMRVITADDLAAAGLPSELIVVDDNADTAGPAVSDVTVTPPIVDVRAGPASVDVSFRLRDLPTGVASVNEWSQSPVGSRGGYVATPVTLRSGSASDGVWGFQLTIPVHSPAGRAGLVIDSYDAVQNRGRYDAAALASQGLVDGFEVMSDDDRTPPQILALETTPREVDARDGDRNVVIRARVADTGAGTKNVYVEFRLDGGGPAFGGYLDPASGDATDGWYETTRRFVGSWGPGVYLATAGVCDMVDNFTYVFPGQLDAVPAQSSFVAFAPPDPPRDLAAAAGDSSVALSWSPTNGYGAPITDYVITETRSGRVMHAGTATSATFTGLANGATATFVVRAANKAGTSAPSASIDATPRAAPPPPASEPPPNPPPTTPTVRQANGYWMVGADGAVYAFGDAPYLGRAHPPKGAAAVDLEPARSGRGYWIVDSAGRVSAFGDAAVHGGITGLLAPGEQVTSISATPTGRGYWLFTTRGRVVPYGDAAFLGDMSGVTLNAPVLDSIPTPSGLGYYMVASDGGIFTSGDASFHGSMGGMHLNAPVQSLVPDPEGDGYWLVASDGGIFAFETPFLGSMGATRLNAPISGMVSSGSEGYLMIAEDGGVFTFGTASFLGSLGSMPPPVPITSVALLSG